MAAGQAGRPWTAPALWRMPRWLGTAFATTWMQTPPLFRMAAPGMVRQAHIRLGSCSAAGAATSQRPEPPALSPGFFPPPCSRLRRLLQRRAGAPPAGVAAAVSQPRVAAGVGRRHAAAGRRHRHGCAASVFAVAYLRLGWPLPGPGDATRDSCPGTAQPLSGMPPTASNRPPTMLQACLWRRAPAAPCCLTRTSCTACRRPWVRHRASVRAARHFGAPLCRPPCCWLADLLTYRIFACSPPACSARGRPTPLQPRVEAGAAAARAGAGAVPGAPRVGAAHQLWLGGARGCREAAPGGGAARRRLAAS